MPSLADEADDNTWDILNAAIQGTALPAAAPAAPATSVPVETPAAPTLIPAAEVVTTPVVEPTETPTEGTIIDPAEEVDDDVGNIRPEKGKAIRLKGPDFHFAALTKSGMSPAEAFQQAYGTSPTHLEETPSPNDQGAANQNQTQTSAQIEAKIAALEAELLDAGANEGLLTTDIAKKQIEHAKLCAQLQPIKQQEAQAHDAEEVQFATARNDSLEKAKAMHPDAANPDSVLGKAVAQVLGELPAEVLALPNAPEIAISMAFTRTGVTPVTSKTPSHPLQTQPLPARTMIPPVLPGNNGGGVNGPPAYSEQDLMSTLQEMSPEELTAALFTPPANNSRWANMPMIR